MAQLVIKGNIKYVKKMFSHLKQEHPSTKGRMIIVDKMMLKSLKGLKGGKRWHLK